MVTIEPDRAPRGDAAAGARWSRLGDGAPELLRPSRPVAIDYASTVLIVSSIFRLFAVALAVGAPAEARIPISPSIVAIQTGLELAMVACGVLVRLGRGWIAAVNVVAVMAFLELLGVMRGPGVIAVVYLLVLSAAFVAIFASKPWFDRMTEWRAARDAARRA